MKTKEEIIEELIETIVYTFTPIEPKGKGLLGTGGTAEINDEYGNLIIRITLPREFRGIRRYKDATEDVIRHYLKEVYLK